MYPAIMPAIAPIAMGTMSFTPCWESITDITPDKATVDHFDVSSVLPSPLLQAVVTNINKIIKSATTIRKDFLCSFYIFKYL